jgi:hypothetical protein
MKDDKRFSRRDFIKTAIAGAAIGALTEKLRPWQAIAQSSKRDSAMPKRPLGKTGYLISIFSLGGQATLEQEGRDEEAPAIINHALDLGVNYIDTAAAYGDGVSEKYVGAVMKTRRNEVFLATKTRERSYDGSMRLLERSLKNLQTDHVDLWQLHNVRTDDDLEKIFARNGAIKALEKARDEKLVRFLGITGHRDPHVLRKGIERYRFDSILMALNAADRHHQSFIEHLLPTAVEKGLAIIGMKIPARGRIFREDGITSMRDAMRYVLTLPVSTIVVGISTLADLEENVRIAREFEPCTEAEMKRLEELTKSYYADASWFKEHW